MTIVGLGMDATEIERIAATVERYGERFLRRIFTPRELEVPACDARIPHRTSPAALRRRKLE